LLKPCPECKNEVSDSAVLCPHCGYQLLGRAALVRCPTCMADILPVRYVHDTVSLYCPLCKTAVTNLRARRALTVFAITFTLLVLAVLVFGGIWILSLD